MLTSRFQVVKVEEAEESSLDTKTLWFRSDLEAQPGQFLMVWVPGVDEVPMALSAIGPRKAITVREVGEATHALCSLEKGDLMGIRGPYGRGFWEEGESILFIGGGNGVASLMAAIENSPFLEKSRTVAIGAKSSKELLFVDRCKRSGADVHIATDDGSEGFHGFVTDLAAELMESRSFDQVITCGPEVMMKKVVQMCKEREIPVQASLERMMRCGIGLCDSCSLGDLLVCKDGPVFSGEELLRQGEFGRIRRDLSGRKVSLSE